VRRRPTLRRKMFALIAAIALPCAHGQNAPGEAPPDVSIVLCQNDTSSGFDDDIRAALVQTLALSGEVKTVVLRRRQCASMPDATCFAGPHALVCQTTALIRIFKASAWMSQTFVASSSPGYEAFRLAHPRAVGDAFRFADGDLSDASAVPAISRMHLHGSGEPAPADARLARLDGLYQGIVRYNLAMLIGHELSHVNGEKCPITSRSFAESSGLFKTVLASQGGGALFCPRDPNLFEVRADACGLRHIYALDSKLAGDSSVSAQDGEFVRRAAADMMAFEAVTGWRHLEGVAKGKFVILPQTEYLYGPFRALLFASEVNATRKPPDVCGEAAAIFVRSVQEIYKSCGDHAGGIVPDEMLARLPKGVEASWNGAPWTEASYACQ
jgi:hypothetical protein